MLTLNQPNLKPGQKLIRARLIKSCNASTWTVYCYDMHKIKIQIQILVKQFFRLFGIGILRHEKLLGMEQFINSNVNLKINFLETLGDFHKIKLITLIQKTKSELLQDIFVLGHLKYKQKGYFVEFGASDGIQASNTYLLENEFKWRGILVEPARVFHDKLRINRPNSIIENLCVWSTSKQNIVFNETQQASLSTILTYSQNDKHKESRKNGKEYFVESISLLDLLLKHHAPKQIDYLSIDTEGTEFEILRNFDFNKFTFSVITVEHNFSNQRENIFNLLAKFGYVRVFQNLSQYDDWYIHS